MKKLFYSVLLIAFAAAFANAQSFQFIHEGNTIPNGGTIQVSDDISLFEIVAEMGIKNTTSNPIDAKLRKFEVDVLPGTSNLFCWGLCFPPFVFESPSPIVIQPNAICEEFSGHYTANGIYGVSIMRYTVFDAAHVADSAYFFVEFNAGTVGLTDYTNNKISVSNPYPNPAKSQTSFNYQLPANTTNASIKIHNLLGSVVKEVQLTGQSGKVSVNVNDLNDGVYFYSVVVNNETYETKRLIVSR